MVPELKDLKCMSCVLALQYKSYRERSKRFTTYGFNCQHGCALNVTNNTSQVTCFTNLYDIISKHFISSQIYPFMQTPKASITASAWPLVYFCMIHRVNCSKLGIILLETRLRITGYLEPICEVFICQLVRWQ